MQHLLDKPLALRRSPVEAGNRRGDAGFIDEDKPLRNQARRCLRLYRAWDIHCAKLFGRASPRPGLFRSIASSPKSCAKRRTALLTVCPGFNPNDFIYVLKRDLIRFQERYEKSAKPFERTFTRRDLHDLLAKLNTKSDHLAA